MQVNSSSGRDGLLLGMVKSDATLVREPSGSLNSTSTGSFFPSKKPIATNGATITPRLAIWKVSVTVSMCCIRAFLRQGASRLRPSMGWFALNHSEAPSSHGQMPSVVG